MLKLTTSKEELLHALGEFLEHFPLPQNGGSAKKKKNSYEKPAVQLITLHEILEPVVKAMVRQAVPLQPMKVNSGADNYLQPVEDSTLEQVDVLRRL
ncbi:centromere protein K-like isoform X2 [Falco rusticolus]|nr:centromere protein K-like isoform X2 [Falco rusticolus]